MQSFSGVFEAEDECGESEDVDGSEDVDYVPQFTDDEYI
jgi:hypothetical protein